MADALKPRAEQPPREDATVAPPATVPGNDNTPLIDTVTLIVDSMVCGTCMISVEETLRRQPGVVSARVNLTTKRVLVTFDRTRSTVERLMDVLDAAGFPAAELVDGREASEHARDQDFLRRLGVAGFAAANIMLLSVSVWAGTASDMGAAVQGLFHWLSALIALPAVAYAGQPFFRSAAQAIKGRRLNMDVPISLGVLLATGMSLYQTARGSEQVYFDAAVTLLFFLLIGRFLDQRMRTRAAGAAANLLGLKAAMATVVRADGTTERVSARGLSEGDSLLVSAGERLAADGRITKGVSEIEESLITGESVPRHVASGDEVYAGTLNTTGPIVVTVTATGQSTLLAEISRLMEAAEQGRGRYVRLADRAARMYAPAVHILGALTFAGWLAVGAGWETALTTAIAVLIITCPCALALAVPAVQVAAASRLMARGIIVKSADGLERMAEVDTIVLDKTGTLSLGEPRLLAPDGLDRETIAGAAALAAHSRHPYSRAIVKVAGERRIKPAAAENVREVPGNGLVGHAPGGEARLGSAEWVGIDEANADKATLWYRGAGGAPVALEFEDALRADAGATVRRLGQAGFAIELLSGDRTESVAAAAREAGILRWRAGQRPADKIARLAALEADGHRVLMVGDGLNDAPALAAGHASLSPSTAADISQAAADAVFQGHKLGPIAEAVAVAREARRMALQNFAIALGYNLVFVPLAVAGFVTPLIAAVAMSASSIAVTANAVRLKSKRLAMGTGDPS